MVDQLLAEPVNAERPESALPQGWEWVALGQVAAVNPRDTAIRDLPGDEIVSFVPMAAVDSVTGTIARFDARPLSEVRKGFTAFADDDVIFAKITPCMENGKAAIARNLKNGRGFGSTEFHVLRATSVVSAEWLFYFVRQESFRRDAKAHFSGTAGQLRVPARFMESYPVPLPPLAEQHRIVAAIEEQFSRLDAGVAALQRARATLTRYRAAVLQAACTGRLVPQDPADEPAVSLLTREKLHAEMQQKRAGRLWGSGMVPLLSDKERRNMPTGWTWAKVRDLGWDSDNVVQVGPMSMRSQDFVTEGVPVLNVGCVKWDHFDESKLDYLPAEKAAAFDRYRIQAGDVLFTRSGTVGRSAVATDRQDGSLMTFHLLRVRPSPDRCVSGYLRIVFEGAPHIRRQTRDASIGTTRSGFNTNLLASLDVPLPPLSEQRRIVAEVERLLSVVHELDAVIAVNLARAGRLRQAILQRAFSGRLVPQDPEDAPASVLLARARAGRDGASGGTEVRPTIAQNVATNSELGDQYRQSSFLQSSG